MKRSLSSARRRDFKSWFLGVLVEQAFFVVYSTCLWSRNDLRQGLASMPVHFLQPGSSRTRTDSIYMQNLVHIELVRPTTRMS